MRKDEIKDRQVTTEVTVGLRENHGCENSRGAYFPSFKFGLNGKRFLGYRFIPPITFNRPV